MVICLERGADLHVAQLMPLPLTATHPGSPGKGAVKRVCVYVCGVMQVASDTGKSSEHGRRQDFHVGGRTEESQGHRRRGGEEL